VNKLWFGPKKPFARLQFVLIAGVLAFTGTFVVNRIMAGSGTMYLAPSTMNVNIGDTVTVGIRENSVTDLVNAVEADIRFDANKLQYVGVDETGSAFGLVAATAVSTGSVNIARGVNGGTAAVSGDQLVTTVTFKALAAGSVPVTFAATSVVVRSSDSTNVLAATLPTTFTLADTGAPTVPTGLSASAIAMASIGLTWTASTDNVATTGYRIYRDGVQIGTSASTSFTATGLLPSTAYIFSVAAVDAAGNVSSVSTAVPATTLADTQAPSVPGIPVSSSQTISGIALSWTASTDNVGVASYKIFRNGVQIASQAGTTFADQNLAPNTSYSYTVAAVDMAGNSSAQSGAGIFKTLADTIAPSIPGGLSGTVSGTDINLSWTASTDNIAVIGYWVYRDGVLVGTSVINSFTVKNAPTGTHAYGVVAVDAANNKSAQSAGVNIAVWGIGDINHDGAVNVFDLSIMLSNWNHTGVNTSDLNSDSVVNVFDLSIMLSRWTG
jgi:chitodextrinase